MATIASQAVEEQAAREAPAPPTRLRRLRIVAHLTVTAVVLAGVWWFLAPAQLGGKTAFMTVDGTSMYPTLKPSELVVLRQAHTYKVGDIVGYRSSLLRRVVLHRIVAFRDGHYIFKGDHNTFLDPDHPTRVQLVGKLWVHLPRAGRAVGLLHTPWVVAALAAVLVLTVGLGGKHAPSEEQREPR
jgi:signal peptidase I